MAMMTPALRIRAMPNPRGRRSWYRIDAKASEDEAEIWIFDEISYWGITAADFVRELREINASKLTLHLNSPGGDVFDGIAIHTALRDHPATVEARVDGLAASIASVIAMAGDRVVMSKHATMMIHDPWAMVIGDARDMRKTAETLDQLGDTIAGIYAERSGGSVREWRDRMLEETWFTDQTAVDAGLADEVAGEPAAENSFDLSIFRHPPAALVRPAARVNRQPTKRELEDALRDAGLSRTEAKTLLRDWGSSSGAPRDAAKRERLLSRLKHLAA